MSLKKLSIFFAIFFTATKLFAAEISNHQYNFFTGILTLVMINRQQCCLVFNIRMKILKETLL